MSAAILISPYFCQKVDGGGIRSWRISDFNLIPGLSQIGMSQLLSQAGGVLVVTALRRPATGRHHRAAQRAFCLVVVRVPSDSDVVRGPHIIIKLIPFICICLQFLLLRSTIAVHMICIIGLLEKQIVGQRHYLKITIYNSTDISLISVCYPHHLDNSNVKGEFRPPASIRSQMSSTRTVLSHHFVDAVSY